MFRLETRSQRRQSQPSAVGDAGETCVPIVVKEIICTQRRTAAQNWLGLQPDEELRAD